MACWRASKHLAQSGCAEDTQRDEQPKGAAACERKPIYQAPRLRKCGGLGLTDRIVVSKPPERFTERWMNGTS